MAKTSLKQYRYATEKPALLARINRLEGQAQGVKRMIEDDRYCIDIVQQLNAVSAAAKELALVILQSHIKGCIIDAIKEDEGDYYIDELMKTIRKATT